MLAASIEASPAPSYRAFASRNNATPQPSWALTTFGSSAGPKVACRTLPVTSGAGSPQRVLTWSPEWNWARFRTSCHADHRATGELALTAIYPDAGNRFAHPQLLDNERLEPWNVPEIWLINGREPNHYVDITNVFERKVAALRTSASQTADLDRLVSRMQERIAPNTVAAGLPEGRFAEAFQVVTNG
jgi:LmbE family N-acetylglucosaminyl deacetylase